MSVTYLNYNASGTEIIDEALVINTAGSQQLVHDHVISIEVWTGEGMTGSQLIASTDYVLGDYDSFYKTYNSITFLTHNGDTVYCTYLTKGDKNSADDVNSKADKVASPTAGNFAGLDANGNLTDSTSKAADFATSGHSHSNASAEAAGFMSADDKTKLTGIAENANNYTHPNHSGDVTSVGDGETTIANDAVTNAKLADMAANSIKGNATADSADPSDIPIAPNKFPARASTGNLEAKSITDFGLGLVAAADAAAGRTALGAAPTVSPTFTGILTVPRAAVTYSSGNNIWALSQSFVSELHNKFFLADKRFSVSTSGDSFYERGVTDLFNLDFNTRAKLYAGDTIVITVDVSTRIGSFTYSQGYIVLSFYTSGYVPESIAIRQKTTSDVYYDVPAGEWMTSSVYIAEIPVHNYTKLFEITLSAKAASETWITQIEYFQKRPVGEESPIMLKTAINNVFNTLNFRDSAYNLMGAILPDTGALQIAKIYPVADSTTALQITKANGTTPVLTVDTTNSRLGVGKTPTEPLDVAGNIKCSGYLELSEMSEPSAGAADTARLYAVANGSLTDIRVRAYGEAGQRIALCGRENTFAKTQGFDIVNIGNSGTSKTIDWTAGNKQKMTLTGDCEVSFTDPSGSAPLELRLIQDTTGGRTVTWSGMTLKWEGGIAATLTAASNAIDIVEFTYDSGEDTYYGSCKNDFKASA